MGHVAPSLEAESGGQPSLVSEDAALKIVCDALERFSGAGPGILLPPGRERQCREAIGALQLLWSRITRLTQERTSLRSALMFAREILKEADMRLGYEPGSLGAIEMAEAFEMIEAALNKGGHQEGARRMNGWRSTSNVMPDEGSWVLVYSPEMPINLFPCTAWWDGEGHGWMSPVMTDELPWSISHWMTIPAVPGDGTFSVEEDTQ